LFDFKHDLNIDEVLVFKNLLQPWKSVDLDILIAKGITVITSDQQAYSETIQTVDYIFETTANTIGLKNRNLYIDCKSLIGVCAQGSEKGFGIPFMSGLNDDLVLNQKFVQIVSCNTHGAASLLQTICGDGLKDLSFSDFVVVRRSEDLGNHERLVSANVVARHLSDDTGTHHAIDVKDMYNSMDINCNITSSDITTPSQLMHSTRFTIQTKSKLDFNTFNQLIAKNNFISISTKFDSNLIFELGRRYGKYGRIYNHVIVLTNNLLFTDNSVKGWAFVPQEGNSIISTIHAFLLQTNQDNLAQKINIVKTVLLRRQW
jgi:glyceraldehyde-3-phosphate dehydrogenase (NAD(P))